VGQARAPRPCRDADRRRGTGILPGNTRCGTAPCGRGRDGRDVGHARLPLPVPVTGQPDYASIAIGYRGPRLDRAALAAYLFGYRLHPGFHEHCVERIFTDIARACRPGSLRVEARFTRRGGVDINPVRATPGMPLAPSASTFRQ
jgi:hypothetical protein